MTHAAHTPSPLLTAREAQALRQRVGLTRAELARVLALGANGTDTVRGWETDKRPVSGPVARALQALADGWRPADFEARRAEAAGATDTDG